jgi:hypothetical protein
MATIPQHTTGNNPRESGEVTVLAKEFIDEYFTSIKR